MKKLMIALLLFPAILQATEIIELNKNTDEMNVKILEVVNGITGNGMKNNNETRGFDYRYTSKTLSPFNLDYYLGRLDEKKSKTLLRVESPLSGLEKSVRLLIEKELVDPGKPVNFRDYRKKYHLFSVVLDLAFPAASVYYNGKNSPLYTDSDRKSKIAKYIFYDILLVGGAYYYAQSKMKGPKPEERLFLKPVNRDPLKSQYGSLIIGAFLTTRLIRLAGAINETTSHNRILQFSLSKNY